MTILLKGNRILHILKAYIVKVYLYLRSDNRMYNYVLNLVCYNTYMDFCNLNYMTLTPSCPRHHVIVCGT